MGFIEPPSAGAGLQAACTMGSALSGTVRAMQPPSIVALAWRQALRDFRAGFVGALWLGGTMLGAVGTHLLVIGGSPVPAIVLGLSCAFVAFRLWPSQGAPLLGR